MQERINYYYDVIVAVYVFGPILGLDVGEQGTRAIEDSRSNSWLRIHDALIEKVY